MELSTVGQYSMCRNVRIFKGSLICLFVCRLVGGRWFQRSTGPHKCIASCGTKGLPYQLTFSCYSFSSLITAKSGNSESLRISLSLTYQGVFIARNAKTLGFYHLQLSYVGPRSGYFKEKA